MYSQWLADVLGPNLVHAAEERVRRELFDAGAETALINALQRPEIVTASAAIAAGSIGEVQDDDSEMAERDADGDDRAPARRYRVTSVLADPLHVSGDSEPPFGSLNGDVRVPDFGW